MNIIINVTYLIFGIYTNFRRLLRVQKERDLEGRSLMSTIRVVCGKRHKTAERPSVRLSVCPINRQQRRRLAVLLLRILTEYIK